ncbi:MAG: hypothetical protein ACTSR8_04895 [Promethearchaeota archaeon]
MYVYKKKIYLEFEELGKIVEPVLKNDNDGDYYARISETECVPLFFP